MNSGPDSTKAPLGDLNHQDQWYEIWDIIFPGEKRPASALVGSYAEEMVLLLRSLWINRQNHILDSVLDTHGAGNVDRSQLNGIMSSLFDSLQAETSGSPSGYSSRPGVKLTTFGSDVSLMSHIASEHRTVAPEINAASDLGFQSPFDLGPPPETSTLDTKNAWDSSYKFSRDGS